MKRVGLEVDSHSDAIRWCVQRGHSTKKLSPSNDWAQHLPADAIGNPFRGVEKTRYSDNHHMGEGLAKLFDLVTKYRGILQIVSGDGALIVDNTGGIHYCSFRGFWPGVAISCGFYSALISKIPQDEADDDVTNIMRAIGVQK